MRSILITITLISFGVAQPSFTAADIATSADGVRSVFIIDLDSDGDLDIISASYNDDTIAWYENNGAADPSFTAADINTGADGSFFVFAADMDKDGDIDILSANKDENTISWYENDGAADPSWTAADIATSANGARSVFVADMDNDGDLDILSASQEDHTIAWYENNGAADPTWTAANITTAANGARSVVAADMDHDGDLDILATAYVDDKILWYENNGAADPSWTAITVATSADGAFSIRAADIDNDGDQDIVSGSFLDNAVAWYENNSITPSLPSFTERTIEGDFDGARSVYAVDMDGDGDMDVVGAAQYDNDIAWFENIGLEVSGNAGFRMLSSPVAGTIYDELLAPFWTQGMTGADDTGGDANVWTYNECRHQRLGGLNQSFVKYLYSRFGYLDLCIYRC